MDQSLWSFKGKDKGIKPKISPDRSNDEWVRALSGTGEPQAEAIHDLRQFLLQVALYTLYRNIDDLRALSHSDRLALAEDCTQEALITVLNHLAEFKGDSKFTTWAYKFAVNFSLARARREGWKHISPAPDSQSARGFDWLASKSRASQPDAELQVLQADVFAVLDEAIRHDLTDKQRMVFRLIVFEQCPMDGVVQHLGVNRNAVYKLMHDARKKLKRALQAHGFGLDETLHLFGDNGEIRFP